MKRLAFALALICGCLAGAAADDYAPNEVLVKFREETPLFAAAAALGSGARIVQSYPDIAVRRVRLSGSYDVDRAIRFFRTLKYVEFAEPNYYVRACDIPNDPQYSLQWHLDKIACPDAWDLTHGSTGVVIAVVDTGVDLGHPDLRNKIVPGYDIRNGDSVAQDDSGHGTHVAGIAAASTHNGVGIAGVAYSCRIMPVKVLTSGGTGTVGDVAAGITYAVDNGAKVVSLSLGTPSASGTLKAAVDYAWNHQVLVVAAAGNDNSNAAHYPAAFSSALGVAATDAGDLRAGFSNFGPWVSVAAPGVQIQSTYLGAQYRSQSGTSMATPQVAGLAALLWSHLGLSTDISVIRQRIEETAIPVGNWLAFGRIDAGRALPSFDAVVRRSTSLQSHTVTVGQVLGGQLSSLASSDNDHLSVRAVRAGTARLVEVLGTAFPEWQGQKIGLQVAVEGNATPKLAMSASLWNWAMGRWDVMGHAELGAADGNLTLQTADPEPYVSPSGEVRVRFLKIESRNRVFCIRVDKVELISMSSE